MSELELSAIVLAGLLSRDNAGISERDFYIKLAIQYARELRREFTRVPSNPIAEPDDPERDMM